MQAQEYMLSGVDIYVKPSLSGKGLMEPAPVKDLFVEASKHGENPVISPEEIQCEVLGLPSSSQLVLTWVHSSSREHVRVFTCVSNILGPYLALVLYNSRWRCLA